ncbi:FAD-dependent oxidoreductase [Methyloversatilis discipulorum]|uniref:FAD-dependent oxidoreductase n=1 Tax=Methyloversatilis discipulorum TaxID=1119528 RepID=UPI001A636405|nr:FAD-dependent oxidoreductase [Methyloversatilis discipulorum]MBL8469399.1 FAD-dependent oxidoreductase [Methyloversatilis discipulorum]
MVNKAALPPSLLLVGVGRFGREHLKEWQALSAEGRVRIAGIVASSATSRELLNTETGLPTFASLADGLALAPDMVDICTPSSLHPAMVREAIAYADVLVEKPLAFTRTEAADLYALADASGRRLVAGHLYRHHPLVIALIDEIAMRGTPRDLQLTFTNPLDTHREGEDPFFEWIHAFDLFDVLADSPASTVGAWQDGACAEASLRSEKGLSARMVFGWRGIEPSRQLTLAWPDCRVHCDFRDNIITTTTRGRTDKRFFGPIGGVLRRQFEAFLGACSGDIDAKPDAHQVMAVVSLAERARNQALTRRTGPSSGKSRPRVAVIGGGVFGATCAVELAADCDVTLFERHPGLLTEASYLNQWRHHSGFHYPRSIETMLEVQDAKGDFESVYEDVVLRDIDAYYAVSALGREISARRYLATCRACGLEFREVPAPTDIVDPSRISVCLHTDEAVVDIGRLSARLLDTLRASPHIDLRLGSEIVAGRLLADGRKAFDFRQGTQTGTAEFDFVVNATYANTNRIAQWFGFPVRPMRFDLLEMAVYEIPDARRFMMTILDAPFTSLTSIGRDGYFMLSHIHQSILASAVTHDGLPPTWEAYPSNRDNLLRHGLRYMPLLANARYVESRVGVRTVEAYSEDFDGRPTVVTPHGFGCWSVLGGKIITAVSNAREISAHIARESAGR